MFRREFDDTGDGHSNGREMKKQKTRGDELIDSSNFEGASDNDLLLSRISAMQELLALQSAQIVSCRRYGKSINEMLLERYFRKHATDGTDGEKLCLQPY